MRRCAHCGAVLAATSRSDRRYCSGACRIAAFRARRSPATGLDQLAAALEPHVSEAALVTGVAVAAQQSWTAAAWMLERQHPQRWAGGAIGVDAELAATESEEDAWPPSDAA